MGNALKDNGDLDSAIECYQQSLKIKPDHAEVHNNIGIILAEKGDPEAALDSYAKALKLKPNYFEACHNKGVTLYNKGDLEAAIDSYKQALKIKPDFAEAFNNIGIALFGRGELEAAIGSYTQAITINPDYAEAYSNMGNALFGRGELEAAIKSYNQALRINHESAEVWDSIQFTLQAIKLQVPAVRDLLSTLNPQKDSEYFQVAMSVLNYRLNQGGESAGSTLNEALSLLPSADNTSIKNPKITNSNFLKKGFGSDKIITLVHFGRSGTGLLHSLIDNHPEVSTMPSIYFSEYFNPSTWEKIIAGGWNEMVDRFISIYEVLFNASARQPIETKSKKFINYMGQQEGMANVGDQKNEVLTVDQASFREELSYLMSIHDHLDAFIFFKLAHAAYDKSLNDHNHKSLIFYHIHNPDTYAKLNAVRAVPNANWIMMVREPLQTCESWIKRDFHQNEHFSISTKIITMLFELDNVIYQKQNSIGVRLEDLKESPRKTIPALCDWMGIKETESLYEMTAQGKKWWGDTDSPDYQKDGMEPFGKTSIRRKVGSVFTENDQFILNTLFYPFSAHFSYVEKNLEQFKADLKTIRPMLDDMFGFEKTMAEVTQVDAEQYRKSGSYLYLRSGLIERWNVLTKFDTYPNMIKPLNIN